MDLDSHVKRGGWTSWVYHLKLPRITVAAIVPVFSGGTGTEHR
jgi:hypothetical protein